MIVVPVVALAIPPMRIVPALYSWRVRSKVFRWYGEVKGADAQRTRRP